MKTRTPEGINPVEQIFETHLDLKKEKFEEQTHETEQLKQDSEAPVEVGYSEQGLNSVSEVLSKVPKNPEIKIDEDLEKDLKDQIEKARNRNIRI